MKYSFIIPVYNRPDEVDELLASLTRQTISGFEAIVVEDGSAIPCRDVCDKYASQLDLHYYAKPNSGPGQSRNYGVERATGDYVIVLDSDVVLPDGYLKAVDDELQRESADAFGGPDCAHPSFTPTQKAISYSMTSFFTTGGIRGGKKKLDKFYPRSFNMGLRRDVYMQLGGFSKMRFGEDIDFSIRIFKAGCRCRLFPEAWVWHKRRTGVYCRRTDAHATARGRRSVVALRQRQSHPRRYRHSRSTTAAAALFSHHLRRLLTSKPQSVDRIAQHTRRLHTAHGLWLRIHQRLVATLRARQRRVLRIQQHLL